MNAFSAYHIILDAKIRKKLHPDNYFFSNAQQILRAKDVDAYADGRGRVKVREMATQAASAQG